MTPYYDEGGVTIYHGDCREVLPTLADGSVDMLLTDPPYGLDIGYGRTALGLRFIAGDGDVGLLLYATRASARLLADDRWAAVFCGYSAVGQVQSQFAAIGLDVKTAGVWDKGAPTLGEGIRNQYEMFVLARKGKPAERWCGGNVWKARGPGRPDHPHQKPLRLIRKLVEHYSEWGGVVLDPCMGSGTTLRAAKDCGRSAIGIEVEERYCELAAQRGSPKGFSRLEGWNEQVRSRAAARERAERRRAPRLPLDMRVRRGDGPAARHERPPRARGAP